MSIVDWGNQQDKVFLSSDLDTDGTLLFGLLKGLETAQWEGRIVYKASRNVLVKTEHVTVELKKMIGDASVKIIIGTDGWAKGDLNRNITISTNGKMRFLQEELTEMHLAITEAQNVLLNYKANGWKK